MPEGPEVRCITIKLNHFCQGQKLKAIKWNDKSKYRSGLPQYPEFSKYLPGTITGITCKGKQIIFILQSDQSSDSIYIKSTLGLEGRWSFRHDDNKHANLWLELDSYNLYYIDSRHFGNITLYTSTDDLLNDLNGKVGPDLLAYAIEFNTGVEVVDDDDKITIEKWTAKLRNKRLKNKQICQFLMEQKYFSGIGNYLKAEILYDAKIRPDRLLSQLSDQDITHLYQSTLKIIYNAFCAGGLTIKSYWQPTSPDAEGGKEGGKEDGKESGKEESIKEEQEKLKGKYKKVIYDCSEDPLGHPIVKETFKDGRTTHWVPQIQS